MKRTVVLAFLVLASATLFGACSSAPIEPGVGCLGAGVGCAVYTDCCSLDCNAGVCIGGGACLPAGDACGGNPDCCNNACVQGFCADCLGPMQGCADGAECCSGKCDPMNHCMP